MRKRIHYLFGGLCLLLASQVPARVVIHAYPVPAGSHPHDVAPTPDGRIWYTAQAKGVLGQLDPRTGRVEEIPLGPHAAPHGVIVGPDGAAWVTDGGLNAIVRVDPHTRAVRVFPLPKNRPDANLNTATFDRQGILWFTGQAGVYGRLEPRSGRMQVFDAPRGQGPYGITTTRNGNVYFASLAGNYIGRIDTRTAHVTVLQPPTPHQGARRIWGDSHGRVWFSEWTAGQLARYDPATRQWQSWRLPGAHPQPYALFVDARDQVWLSDWGANAVVRFDPSSQHFTDWASPRRQSDIRQMLGRGNAVWAAESGTDHLVVYRSE